METEQNCVSEWVGHEEMRQRVKKKKKLAVTRERDWVITRKKTLVRIVVSHY